MYQDTTACTYLLERQNATVTESGTTATNKARHPTVCLPPPLSGAA